MRDGPAGGEAEALTEMLAIMRAHGLDALTVRAGEATYELVLRADDPPHVAGEAPPAPASLESMPGQQPAANYKKIAAPIIGVFYRAPSPGAETFVEVGDRVEVGQVLCILEAMKLMNEITSDYAGVVRRVLVENGELVSLGEDMFWIEP